MNGQTLTLSPIAPPAGAAPPATDAETMPLPDQTGRDAFVEAHYRGLFAWLWWLTGCREAAADLTQESFAAYWSSLERTRVREPRVWLYRIARNRWRKWCRDDAARRRPPVDAGDELATAEDDPAAAAARAELARAVVDAVGDLPRPYREAMTLRYWGDLTHAEIGRVMGIPAALARWRVHQGRRLVRDRLARLDDVQQGGSSNAT